MNTTIERLIEIDSEREATMSDTDFQKWMKELNISASCVNRDSIFRATEMMKDYDYSKLVLLS
jgi:phosphoribulokinase